MKLTEQEALGHVVVTEGLRVAESKRYGRYAKSAFDMYEKLHGKQPDRMFRSAVGYALQNFDSWRQNESVTQGSMPYLRDYGFEMITALLPGLIANDICTVQPAKFKNYSIFYQDFTAGTNKGPISQDTNLIRSPIGADSILKKDYTSDAEVNRQIGTGNGSTANYLVSAGVLFLPIVPGTVQIVAIRTTDVTMTVVDDGANNLTGDIASGTNTVSYVTGAINVTFVGNVKTAEGVFLTYEFVGEGSEANAAELNLAIREIQGVAKEDRLRYNFSIESQFSYKQQFGKSMDADMLAMAIGEVRKEIDMKLIYKMWQMAQVQTGPNACAGAVTWDRTPEAGVQYFYWREQFIDTLNAAGNLIVKSTHVGDANVAVGGINFKQVVENIGPRFKGAGTTQVKGSRLIGTIDGKIKCFYEPMLSDNDFFVTYKGGPLEIGLSFNPWMPLFASEPHMLDNGKLHRYLITSNGSTPITRKFFVKGTLEQST